MGAVMAVPTHMRPGWRGSNTKIRHHHEARRAELVMVVYSLVQVSHAYFTCPYCGTTWPRGGKKEGFVKSGANNHVSGCADVVAWLLGYVLTNDGYAEPREAAYPHTKRNITALIAKKRRTGTLPRFEKFKVTAP